MVRWTYDEEEKVFVIFDGHKEFSKKYDGSNRSPPTCKICNKEFKTGFVGFRWDDWCFDIGICKNCLNTINKLVRE